MKRLDTKTGKDAYKAKLAVGDEHFSDNKCLVS